MNLVEHVREIAKNSPEKTAYHYLGQDTSYAEFDEKVEKLAFSLKEIGIEKGNHVAFLLGNSPEFLISLYACMRLGATAVPVNPIFQLDEISYIFENGDVDAVIAIDTLLPLLDQGKNRFSRVEKYIICETASCNEEMYTSISNELKNKIVYFSELLQTADGQIAPRTINEEDTAIILYTSGTTGQPKGAQISHRNLYANARDVAHFMEYTSRDRVIATLPLFHVFALTVVANAPLFIGATVLIAPRFSPGEILQLAKTEKATIFAGVPTMYNFLYQYESGNAEDFATLRLAISGGAPLPAQVLHNFEGKFNVKISEGYGLSEASPVTCFNPQDRVRKVGSIGTSITNVDNKIVDEDGNELSPHEVGELIVRGPNVMKGYYKNPEGTSAAIRDGWLYTGDLAKRDEENYFYIVDRKKDMIIVGGYKVYPREVEEVLYQHQSVKEAVVVGIPDENFGEAVCAFVVLNDQKANEEELKVYCAQYLAKYKVPTEIRIVGELPKNSTGKILRRNLRIN
ncbi:long-chain-fatty-acid--CoA ligase [Ureibacillus manganicus]|uniref:Long-chain fatty acid--CoA ligase n=1 Tax=Ureibacillus manganicus DSM 26584 TaxID=1384049 RepID=A0A0A3I923_9BACL|nr:long-chain-fatty-acid--CoA ligase [Ureibacillus manganicus]KGR80000.1 long-chain fatty acid--CoA ligase [Ureibacillus manganicus DSM 26584]